MTEWAMAHCYLTAILSLPAMLIILCSVYLITHMVDNLFRTIITVTKIIFNRKKKDGTGNTST